MTMRVIPDAQAVSEFIAGYNGDCGEDAALALAHVVDPNRFALNAATLGAEVRWEIAQKLASANGSEPINAIAAWLKSQGLNSTNYGYAEPFGADWRGALATWGGVKPIIFEYAHAGHLPGDETGVAYHFNTCLGWDPATHSGLFADGDNIVERQGGMALVTYSETDLANAGLCGMLVGEYQLGGVQMSGVPSGWSDNGKDTLVASNGVKVVGAIRVLVLSENHDPSDTPVAPEFYPTQIEVGNPSLGGGAVQFFKISGQVSWNQTFNGGKAWRTWNGQEEAALRAAVDAATAATAAAQANVTAAQGQRDALSAQLASAQAAEQAAQSQVASLTAQLAAAQNAAPAPAPAPTPQERAGLDLLAALKAAQSVW